MISWHSPASYPSARDPLRLVLVISYWYYYRGGECNGIIGRSDEDDAVEGENSTGGDIDNIAKGTHDNVIDCKYGGIVVW